MQAAIMGARELGGPIIAMTCFNCRIFAYRIYGRPHRHAFTEFAYTLAVLCLCQPSFADVIAHDVLTLSESIRPK